MNHRRSKRSRLVFETLEARQVLASFIVANTNDDGIGSMRDAIVRSNQNPGVDTIAFAIPDGDKSIELTSSLPDIVDQVIIDATTQPGYLGIPLVELRGSLMTNGENGLTILAGDSTVKGLAINSFPGEGILITGAGGNTIESNYIGIDLTGQQKTGNGRSGVHILESANNRIGGSGHGNVLSGNRLEGLRIWGAKSISNSVEGNRIGTDANGVAAIANGLSGVLIASGASGNFVGLGFVDSDAAGKRNIISGNLEVGVRIIGSHQNSVKGNYIGLDSAGTHPLGNRLDGVLIEGASNGNLVGAKGDGANDALERNWIAGNSDNGIRLTNASNTQIAGNWIGLDINGVALGNASNGILIDGKSRNNIVGLSQFSPLETLRNIVSGNARYGIYVFDGTANQISGNYIGTSPDGKKAIPNLDGIVVSGGSENNVIGLAGNGFPQTGNLISGNLRNGIWLVESARTKVSANVIGLASGGLVALPNQHSGVWISRGAHDNVIGTVSLGTAASLERNVISGNLLQGVSIGEAGADNNRIAGNLIGTDITGAAAIPNLKSGVLIYNNAKNNMIGGKVREQQNYISGNEGFGIDINVTTNTSVLGNRIGLIEGSQSVLGNTLGGIRISQSSNNQIGDGSMAGVNWIRNNGAVGIQVVNAPTSGNSITNNYISDHSLISVDLGSDGPTPNDIKDADTGSNELQNYPIIEMVAVSSNRTQIAGKLESTPNATFQLDLFSQVDGVLGNQFDTSLSVTTDSNGVAYWLYDQPTEIAMNSVVYATARNALGSQSEISPPKSPGQLFAIQAASNQLREGAPSLAVTLQRPTNDNSQALTVTLTSSDPNQISVPSQVVIPAGQQSVQFSVTAVDDSTFEFPSLVRIIAESTQPSLISGAIQINVLDNDSQWHNYAMPLDVDQDRDISPLDVVIIINYLNSNQNKNLTGVTPPTPRTYIDVDEDMFVSPLDVLIVINYINQRSGVNQRPGGEGEDTTPLQLEMNSDGIENWKRRNERIRDIGLPTPRLP